MPSNRGKKNISSIKAVNAAIKTCNTRLTLNILVFFSKFPSPSAYDINRWVAFAIVELRKPSIIIAPPTMVKIP
jgi:hypothetical protein